MKNTIFWAAVIVMRLLAAPMASAQTAGDWAQALRELDKGLQLHEYYQYGQNLFYDALRQRQAEQAREQAREQAEQEREQQTRYNALLIAQKGMECLGKQDWNGAIGYFTKSLETDPALGESYKGRGVSYYGKGEYDKALADYERALLFNAADAQVYDMRGNLYFQKAEYDRALKDYNYSIRINPASALSYYNRGNAYCQKGEYTKGRADFTAALRINPGMKEARNALDMLDKNGR